MRDFLKSRLQKFPGGVILESLGLIHPATSGNRSVNTMTISRIKTHFAFIFAGLRKCSGVIRSDTTCCVVSASDQTRFFIALISKKKRCIKKV